MKILGTFRNWVTSRGRKTAPKRAVLVFPEVTWDAFRNHLLQPDHLERAAFMLLGRSEAGALIRYYVHRLMPVPDERCAQQGPTAVEPDPLCVLDSFSAYVKSAAVAYVHVHSHPFCSFASFSGTDDAFLRGEVQGLTGYLKVTASTRPRCFLRVVVGQAEAGFTAQVFDERARLIDEIHDIRIVGATGLRQIKRFERQERPAAKGLALSVIERDRRRLDRNLRFLGEHGQGRISATRLAICGLGGAGTEMLKNCRVTVHSIVTSPT
jgi:hypothetical protein